MMGEVQIDGFVRKSLIITHLLSYEVLILMLIMGMSTSRTPATS